MPANGLKQVFSISEPEKGLVLRCRQGDQDAYSDLVEGYRSKVGAVILSIIRRPNDVEDVKQEVFTKVWRNIGQFRLDASLGTWIYKITVRQAYDYLRKRRVRKLDYESDLPGELPKNWSLIIDTRERVADCAETRDYLETLYLALSEEELNFLFLKEVDGFKVEEIAAEYRINVSTLKVKLFRARRKVIQFVARRKLGGRPRSTFMH